MHSVVRLGLAGVLGLVLAGGGARAARGKAGNPNGADSVVQTEMRNVDFRIDHSIVLQIRYLRGRLEPTRPGAPAILDDRTSFILAIDTAWIRISGRAMGELLNRYVFDYPGAPLTGLRVSVEGKRLRQRGRMNGMPFSMLSDVEVTASGELRLVPVKIKAFGIPVKSLMEFLGMRLQKMLDLHKARGIRVVRNDLFISPTAIVPPPIIRGKLAAIELSDSTMVQVFRPAKGETPGPLERPDSATNYVYYRGGSLRFGLLTMTPANLYIKDADPQDPFDVYLAQYNAQLIAGFSRNTANYGLITTMPDYSALPAAARKPVASAPDR